MGRERKIGKLLESYILYSYFVENRTIREIVEDVKKRTNITISKTAVHKVIKKARKYGVGQVWKRLEELLDLLCDKSKSTELKKTLLYNVISYFFEAFLRNLQFDIRAYVLEKAYYFDREMLSQIKKLLNISEDIHSIELDPSTNKLVVLVRKIGEVEIDGRSKWDEG